MVTNWYFGNIKLKSPYTDNRIAVPLSFIPVLYHLKLV